MRELLDSVKDELPKFNDKILVDFRKKEMNTAISFILDRIHEAIEYIGEDIVVSYEIVSPHERAKYEASHNRLKNSVNIKLSSIILVRFKFVIDQETQIEKLMYVPYIHEDGSTIMNGTKMFFQLCLDEKIFSRINNGVTIKVIRSPISFWKNKLRAVTSINTGNTYTDTIIEAKIHYKESGQRSPLKPTLVHYLLCKFGFEGVKERLGIDKDDCTFVQTVPDEPDEFEYFKAQNVAVARSPIIMRVRSNIMVDQSFKRFVISTLHILNGFKKISYTDLVSESKIVFHILLGKLIFSRNISPTLAHSCMVEHIASLDTYLDSINKKVFHNEGIMVDDIYDVLYHIFYNIDKIILECPNNNFYNKKFSSLFSVLIATFVKSLNSGIYLNERSRRKKDKVKFINDMLVIYPRSITKDMYSCINTKMNPDQFNDNILLPLSSNAVKNLGMNKKNSSNAIRAAVNKFHPSFVVVESPVRFSSSNPSINACINPYVEIDEDGGVVRNWVADEVDKLQQYL